jgi:hypothetical protein
MHARVRKPLKAASGHKPEVGFQGTGAVLDGRAYFALALLALVLSACGASPQTGRHVSGADSLVRPGPRRRPPPLDRDLSHHPGRQLGRDLNHPVAEADQHGVDVRDRQTDGDLPWNQRLRHGVDQLQWVQHVRR